MKLISFHSRIIPNLTLNLNSHILHYQLFSVPLFPFLAMQWQDLGQRPKFISAIDCYYFIITMMSKTIDCTIDQSYNPSLNIVLQGPDLNFILTFCPGSRLYWCDAYLDKIESSDLSGSDRKLLLDSSHGTLHHPFDIIFHHGTLMWTDWKLYGIGVSEGSQHSWPKNYFLPGGFSRPGGFHVYEGKSICFVFNCLVTVLYV